MEPTPLARARAGGRGSLGPIASQKHGRLDPTTVTRPPVIYTPQELIESDMTRWPCEQPGGG